MVKRKRTNGDAQNTTQKTKDRATPIILYDIYLSLKFTVSK
jgi:hypothetical protein